MRILATPLYAIVPRHLIRFLLGAVTCSKTYCLAAPGIPSNRNGAVPFAGYIPA